MSDKLITRTVYIEQAVEKMVEIRQTVTEGGKIALNCTRVAEVSTQITGTGKI